MNYTKYSETTEKTHSFEQKSPDHSGNEIKNELIQKKTKKKCQNFKNWGDNEDKLLKRLFRIYGNKWKIIGKHFPTRTPYQLSYRIKTLSENDKKLSENMQNFQKEAPEIPSIYNENFEELNELNDDYGNENNNNLNDFKENSNQINFCQNFNNVLSNEHNDIINNNNFNNNNNNNFNNNFLSSSKNFSAKNLLGQKIQQTNNSNLNRNCSNTIGKSSNNNNNFSVKDSGKLFKDIVENSFFERLRNLEQIYLDKYSKNSEEKNLELNEEKEINKENHNDLNAEDFELTFSEMKEIINNLGFLLRDINYLSLINQEIDTNKHFLNLLKSGIKSYMSLILKMRKQL